MTTEQARGFSSIAILTLALASACGKDSAPSDVVGAGGSSETGGTAGSSGSGQGGKGGTAQGGKGGAQGGSGNTGGSGNVDGGGEGGITGDASVDGATGTGGQPSDCFLNPTTHFEIINACTDSEKVDENPVLPLLYPDGGLPPLL